MAGIFDIHALWKAMQGRSITLSLVLASAILGPSLGTHLRGALAMVGIPWWLAWVAAIVLIKMGVTHEKKLPLHEQFRHGLALFLLLASLAVAGLLSLYQQHWQRQIRESAPASPVTSESETRKSGPRGK